MRGRTGFSAMASNVFATAPEIARQKTLNKRPKMCWVCQQDKPVYQGLLRVQAGLHKFVCKDCLDAKAARKKLDELP